MEYYIIVYKSTFDAMNAEKVLKEKNFKFRIMPTPTSITQSCGICTRFEIEEDVKKIIDENIIEFKAVYHKSKSGFNILK